MKKREKAMKLYKSSRQTSIFPQGIKKQKWYRGNPLTKKDKLYRISAFDYIRGNGGTLRDVAIAWGISPNNGKVGFMVSWYKEELKIK
jgi:hypothetical protein